METWKFKVTLHVISSLARVVLAIEELNREGLTEQNGRPNPFTGSYEMESFEGFRDWENNGKTKQKQTVHYYYLYHKTGSNSYISLAVEEFSILLFILFLLYIIGELTITFYCADISTQKPVLHAASLTQPNRHHTPLVLDKPFPPHYLHPPPLPTMQPPTDTRRPLIYPADGRIVFGPCFAFRIKTVELHFN